MNNKARKLELFFSVASTLILLGSIAIAVYGDLQAGFVQFIYQINHGVAIRYRITVIKLRI